LDEPPTIFASSHVLEVWPGETASTNRVATRAVLLEECRGVLLGVRDAAEHETQQPEGNDANAVPTDDLPVTSSFFLVNKHFEVHPRLPVGRSDFRDSEPSEFFSAIVESEVEMRNPKYAVCRSLHAACALQGFEPEHGRVCLRKQLGLAREISSNNSTTSIR